VIITCLVKCVIGFRDIGPIEDGLKNMLSRTFFKVCIDGVTMILDLCVASLCPQSTVLEVPCKWVIYFMFRPNSSVNYSFRYCLLYMYVIFLNYVCSSLTIRLTCLDLNNLELNAAQCRYKLKNVSALYPS